ncbi:MAG: class I SAM-dependent methyltransferase [Oscillospiraceae bacterium]|nr:class I SAM-dependent methyltransferase [Oscillospiraceae bacterium]
MSAYSISAKVYDLFLDEFDYDRYASYIKKIIETHGLLGSVVDAGCGTGRILKLLHECKNELIGVDISAEMLSIAQRKNTGALLVQQDISKLKLAHPASLIYSSLDVINHLESIDEVGQFFQSAADSLEKDGMLVFDFNLPHKHKVVLADNCFTYEKYKYYLIWNSYYHEDMVSFSLDLFTQQPDGTYIRESEEFSEYTYSLENISNLLKSNFKLLDLFDGDSFLPLIETSNRALVTAIKR